MSDLEQLKAAGVMTAAQHDELVARGLGGIFGPLAKELLTSFLSILLKNLPNLLSGSNIPESAPK